MCLWVRLVLQLVSFETARSKATEAALKVPAFRALQIVNVGTAVALQTPDRCAEEGAEPALSYHNHLI
jgi:hypothetical protein